MKTLWLLPAMCTGGNAKTYQFCVNVDGSETWNFGGMSCRAANGNSPPSGAQVTMTVGGGTYVLSISTSSATTTINGNYSVTGTQLSMTNTSAAPSSVNGCIGQTAVYNLTWDATCAHVTFTKISDQCQQRIADANGATLARQ